MGGLGVVGKAEVCPVAFCGLPSFTSPLSTVLSLGASSSPAGAGLCHAIWNLQSQDNNQSYIKIIIDNKHLSYDTKIHIQSSEQDMGERHACNSII